MPSTAKRRWSRELDVEVDGIAIGSAGPVLVHGYDAPAGGKWLDSVIPGKLGALDRTTGELLWMAPCEVGYGRGFGAGVGQLGQVVALGPSMSGHRIVRMSMKDGELLEVAPIPSFDEASVSPDMVLCTNAGRVFGVDTMTLTETWEYARDGERYHHVERVGNKAIVVYTPRGGGSQGIMTLDAETGEFDSILVAPSVTVVHGIAITENALVALTCDLDRVLPPELLGEFTLQLARHPDEGPRDNLSLLAMRLDAEPGDAPLWYEILETRQVDELPEVSISADSGKLYVERGALLEARDALSGRALGEWTIPGLDEQIDWQVVDGAGLLAEETRVSVFELPA